MGTLCVSVLFVGGVRGYVKCVAQLGVACVGGVGGVGGVEG